MAAVPAAGVGASRAAPPALPRLLPVRAVAALWMARCLPLVAYVTLGLIAVAGLLEASGDTTDKVDPRWTRACAASGQLQARGRWHAPSPRARGATPGCMRHYRYTDLHTCGCGAVVQPLDLSSWRASEPR